MADEVQLPDTEPYRVVMGFATYERPRVDYDEFGNARVIYTRESAMRSETVDLVPREVKRLTDLGAVVPADQERTYDEMSDEELSNVAAARSITVVSSSADPDRPLRHDFINALETFDRGEVVATGVGTTMGGVAVQGVRVGDSPQQVADASQIDVVSASVEEVAAHIQEANLTAPETVALAQDDPVLATKVLDAEDAAQSGDSRKSVVEPLQKLADEG